MNLILGVDQQLISSQKKKIIVQQIGNKNKEYDQLASPFWQRWRGLLAYEDEDQTTGLCCVDH